MTETIYRYHATQNDGWRFNYSRSPHLQQGWIYDGPKIKTPTPGTNGAVPVYQYHYDQSKTYGGWRFFFSTNPNEGGGWVLDGVAFHAFPHQRPGTVPINQYKCQQSDGLRFLLSRGENTEGWTLFGPAFWAYAT